MDLKRNHNPSINKQLLYQGPLAFSDLPEAMAKAMRLFHMKRISPRKKSSNKKFFSTNWKKLLFRPFLEDRPYDKPADSYFIGEDGIPYPLWKKALDQEEKKLKTTITKAVNIADFGAIGDGQTDNTKAFKQAIGNGNVKVTIPPGVFIVKGIELPSCTIITGSGKGKSVLKLHARAPKRRRLLTNRNHIKGNHHVKVENITLDWNVGRLSGKGRTSSGNNFSSCLTYANVTCGWIKQVEALNPGLHCFDVSSTFYTYAGDNTRAKGASKYIWLDGLTGFGFGDDGVTTHHSEHILISNCHMSDPSGQAHKQGFSNSNGFEIDDGSRGVWLVHNSSTRCFGGVEIKAHQTAAAAVNTFIIGHLSVRDNRSFNFRHIGHHLDGDTESQTAFDIIALNLKAIMPRRSDLYKNSAPRALVISAYKNVVIHTFTAVSDPGYNYQNQPMVTVQYRARNIFLHHFNFEHFSTASCDIKIFGGLQRADVVSIFDITSKKSAPIAVHVGKNLKDCAITNVKGKVIWGTKSI